MFGICAGGFQLAAGPLCCAPFFSPSQLLQLAYFYFIDFTPVRRSCQALQTHSPGFPVLSYSSMKARMRRL